MPKYDGYNHFKKIGHKYYLTDYLGILLTAMDEVSLALHVKVSGEATLEKYGTKEAVLEWFHNHQEVLDNEVLVVFNSSNWEVEELNKLLSNHSYATTFYQELRKKCHEDYSKRGSGRTGSGEGKQV